MRSQFHGHFSLSCQIYISLGHCDRILLCILQLKTEISAICVPTFQLKPSLRRIRYLVASLDGIVQQNPQNLTEGKNIHGKLVTGCGIDKVKGICLFWQIQSLLHMKALDGSHLNLRQLSQNEILSGKGRGGGEFSDGNILPDAPAPCVLYNIPWY